jgi:hypothetical protein
MNKYSSCHRHMAVIKTILNMYRSDLLLFVIVWVVVRVQKVYRRPLKFCRSRSCQDRYLYNKTKTKKQTPWPESASELY